MTTRRCPVRKLLSGQQNISLRLFLDDVLPKAALSVKDMLEPVRLRWLEIAAEEGWVDSDHPLSEGIADMNGFCVEPQETYMRVMYRLYREVPGFHAIPEISQGGPINTRGIGLFSFIVSLEPQGCSKCSKSP